MGLDIDVNEYVKTLRVSMAPFKCPIVNCEKNYKSIIGIQYHLCHYNHDNPQEPLLPRTPISKKAGRGRKSKGNPTTPKLIQSSTPQPQEKIKYDENANQIEFKISGDLQTLKINIDDEIPVIGLDVYEKMTQHSSYEILSFEPPDTNILLKLPEATFNELTTYNICDAPIKPNAYIRFIEKSMEEMAEEIDLEVDEEDTMWLSIINQQREEQGLTSISVDILELLMDRLEKESHFQAASNGQAAAIVDEDAICCICMDGECQNTNVILFCDMCNLAVHQDCYGVSRISNFLEYK